MRSMVRDGRVTSVTAPSAAVTQPNVRLDQSPLDPSYPDMEIPPGWAMPDGPRPEDAGTDE